MAVVISISNLQENYVGTQDMKKYDMRDTYRYCIGPMTVYREFYLIQTGEYSSCFIEGLTTLKRGRHKDRKRTGLFSGSLTRCL